MAIEPELRDGCFYIPTFAQAVRLADITGNEHVSLISWTGPYEVVVVYGRASTTGESANGMVNVRIEPQRIYCIRPLAWHHAARQ